MIQQQVVVQQIGNSSMITLPKQIIKQSGLQRGDLVTISAIDDMIQITRENKKKKPLSHMAGSLHIPDFDLKKSSSLIKELSYER